MEDAAWRTLIGRIRQGRCTPFVGAGASHGTLPLGGDIARSWADQFDYPLPQDRDLARVAQYLAVVNDAMWPKEQIVQQFNGVGPPDFSDPTEPHSILAELDLPVYLTTNYDDFMIQALTAVGKRPHREVCRWNEYLRESIDDSVFNDPEFQPSTQEPVVFHLHGTTAEAESIVLTEDDYLTFLVNLSRRRDLLPHRIERALTGASLLFVGYSLEDWSFRVLYQGLISLMESSLRRISVAVQLPPQDQPAHKYLDAYFERKNVSVYWGTARQFAAELRERLSDQSD
jgi:hypothetical protein